MPYIIAIAISFALLVAFTALSILETARGFRVFGGMRSSFDRRVGHVAFIVEHVDLGAFVRDALRALLERVLHDAAHATLIVVRFLERVLTRTVMRLRGRRSDATVPEARSRRTLREAFRHVRSTLRLRRMTIEEKMPE